MLGIFRRISLINCKKSTIKLCQCRNASIAGTQFLEDIEKPKVEYSVTRDQADWKYIERVLPAQIIPEPIKKSGYPSGWKPQSEDLSDRPYFISRTKNHMIPVYLQVKQNGVRRLTMVKKIKGDIWLLHKEILEFLQSQQLRPIRSQVNEFAGYICINGDYVNAIKYWLEKRNF